MKFRTINLSNNAYMKRVGSVEGGQKILEEVGFQRENGSLVLKTVEVERLKDFVQFLEKEISKLY